MTTAPTPQVDRFTLTKAQQEARTQLLYSMANAINALMGQDGIVYTKIPVTTQQPAMLPEGGPNG